MNLSADIRYLEGHIDLLEREIQEVRRLYDLFELWKREDIIRDGIYYEEIMKHQEYLIKQEEWIRHRKEFLRVIIEDTSIFLYHFRKTSSDLNSPGFLVD